MTSNCYWLRLTYFLCRTITRRFTRVFSRRNEQTNVDVDQEQDEDEGGGSQDDEIFTVSSTQNLFMDNENLC